ncbi:MAG TPA: LysR substrate-binding domain-containing protein, partial [Bryobacteraceae bacterium]|nr:LysR substrate-binding domain-containing protein [Bryobacteraceae bacterium]
RFKAAFSANTAPACKAATLAGGGIAILTDFSISEEVTAGRLVRLLPEWTLPSSDIHAVLPVARQYPPKVRTFIDFLKNLA